MASTPDRLQRRSTLLDEVLDLPESQREAWLAALHGESATLAPTLRQMLAQHARGTSGLLDRRPAMLALTPAALAPGSSVGPYRLLAPLGSGGMAEVWLAERADGALTRKVALKLPHVLWAPGLPERFAREREILSTLEHPNIARLYDAGLDQAGRPHMALEFVEGRPIDAYRRDHALSVDARLRLLLQVADAVAFAHSRLVVHRDLKPANILVTEDQQVQLLDFGIAKLLQGEHTVAAETALTELGGRALTRDYASPEQIRGEPVGTASDVYTLAVVAFELLAGVRPYALARAGPAALEQAITQTEVPLASAVAADPALRKRLRGDLDAILNHALRKEATQRYATVDALAQEWRRHLGGQRVFARPDTVPGRLLRVARRHRMPLGAGALAAAAFWLAIGAGATALVILALLIGLGVSVWQARRAREQARLAQVEARTAKAVQGFIEGIFRGNTGDQADPLAARARTAKELLDEGAARIERELDDVPLAKLRVLGVLAPLYREMGEHELEQAIAIVDAWPASANRTAFEQKVATEWLGACVRLGRLDEAQTLAARAAELEVDRMQNHSFAVRFLIHRALLALDLGEVDAARRWLDEAGASIGRDGLAKHPVNVKSYGPARVRLHADLGEGAQAIDPLRAWQRTSGRPEPLAGDDFIGLHTAAVAQLAHGDAALAARLCERGLEALGRHPHRASVTEAEANLLASLGQARWAQGDAASALDPLRRAVALHDELFDTKRSPSLARVQLAYGRALLASGDRAAAFDMLERASAIQRRHTRLGPQHLTSLHDLERVFEQAVPPPA